MADNHYYEGEQFAPVPSFPPSFPRARYMHTTNTNNHTKQRTNVATTDRSDRSDRSDLLARNTAINAGRAHQNAHMQVDKDTRPDQHDPVIYYRTMVVAIERTAPSPYLLTATVPHSADKTSSRQQHAGRGPVTTITGSGRGPPALNIGGSSLQHRSPLPSVRSYPRYGERVDFAVVGSFNDDDGYDGSVERRTLEGVRYVTGTRAGAVPSQSRRRPWRG
ncbi:hypothetical protein B0T26DRAFT_296723 [Lasiosphaeria miniovina]|uniref:Uncharacterized protein n=1 Tax=Lasiosphaeria miniovina TaxID=1954250 RepID=A0AA40AKA9_9PEZI|nr:uncharacterized protein B0T26DRAFT_296723 [Lasiosphaeria miniovina]KAK0717429.1 hypothetical protein B0T26DRAFT_296723 [Lasiosphaeria miniovina]